ncbi:MAG: membrane dipeptidase [Acidimicrobiales bacterium]|nr:membrane dipeptidase [Hyphomonadaceae bacterium]RZV44857.1 MAG: membrane dipeptidase [Acidimicrobiales bacterium]
MTSYFKLKSSGIAAIALTLSLAACVDKADITDEQVQKLHANVLTLDTHVDIPLTFMTEVDPGVANEYQVDLGKMEKGGLDAAFFIVYTPQGELTDEGYAKAGEIAETRIKAIHQMAKAYEDRIVFATTAEQVRKATKDGNLVALVGMENAFPLGPTIDSVQTWAKRGVRYMGITHFGHNQFGDSSNPHPDRDDGPLHNGLSGMGKELINQLNRHGIMVDVSHAGKETMMQAADLSRTPIIASHSGVKAIADTARNLDDEQLRKIKDVGGVAQMVALGSYVKVLTPEQEAFRDKVRVELGLETSEARSAMTDAQEAEYEARLEGVYDIEPRATVADFVDHVDHAVKIAGIDHVGIASDFDGGGGIDGWQDASETQNVTAELIKRGYSDAEISKIWGGNLLRVMEAVEAVTQKQ